MADDLSLPVDRLVHVASAVFALLFTLVVAGLIGELVSTLALRVGVVAEGTNEADILGTVATFGSFLPAVIGYLAITDQWDLVPVSKPTVREGGLIVVVAVALYAVQIGLLLLFREFGLQTGENPATTAAGDPVMYFMAMIVVQIVFVGPAEELLVRGVVQGGLRRSFGPAPAILIASVLFGLLHFGVGGTLPERLAYVGIVTILGALLGILYERTGNIVIPALAHGLYNAIIFGALLWTAL